MAVAFVLRARGAERTIVSEPARGRREAFDGIVSSVVDPTSEDLVSRCRELSLDGEGVAIVFDCAGAQSGMNAACQALRFGGKYVNLAIPKKPVSKRLLVVVGPVYYELILLSLGWESVRG